MRWRLALWIIMNEAVYVKPVYWTSWRCLWHTQCFCRACWYRDRTCPFCGHVHQCQQMIMLTAVWSSASAAWVQACLQLEDIQWGQLESEVHHSSSSCAQWIERVGLGFCTSTVLIPGRSLYFGCVCGVQIQYKSLSWMTVLYPKKQWDRAGARLLASSW